MVDCVAMDVSDVVASTSPGAGTVYGMVVGQVSPVKRSSKRNYVQCFDGQFRSLAFSSAASRKSKLRAARLFLYHSLHLANLYHEKNN